MSEREREMRREGGREGGRVVSHEDLNKEKMQHIHGQKLMCVEWMTCLPPAVCCWVWMCARACVSVNKWDRSCVCLECQEGRKGGREGGWEGGRCVRARGVSQGSE